MGQRQLTFIDNLLDQIDSGLRTTFASAPTPNRPSPANAMDEPELNESSVNTLLD